MRKAKGAETLASQVSHVGVPNMNSFLYVNVAYNYAGHFSENAFTALVES